MFPTVAQVLELPCLRRAAPRVVAAEDALGNTVRWVHVSELLDITHYLDGSELLLTTGLVLPKDPEAQRRYVRELANAHLSGLMIEIGRNFDELSPALVRTAQDEGLPLIALTRDVPFVAITEAVNSLIVNEKLSELDFVNEVYRTFQTLGMSSCSLQDVLREAAALLDAPVVLEGVGHEVIAFDPARVRDPYLLDDWEKRSRRAGSVERTAVVGPESWLVTQVGALGESWGRLIVLANGRVTGRQVAVAETAAATLVVSRLADVSRGRANQLAGRNVLAEIISGPPVDRVTLTNRLQALGIATRGCRYIGLSVLRTATSPISDALRDQALADRVGRAARMMKFPAFAGVIGPNWVSALLVVSAEGPTTATIFQLATRIKAESADAGEEVTIGVGPVVDTIDDIKLSLAEANEVADVASTLPSRKPFYTLSDVHLRGLLHSLQTDARVHRFVERELGRLIEHDRRVGSDLLGALSTYLDCGQNLSAAAHAYRLSRPAFYSRLRQIENLLGASLSDAGDALSLYVAITAMRVMDRPRRTAGAPSDGGELTAYSL